MVDGSIPSTRFKAMELTEGCTKRTASSAPIEKLFQFRMALSVVCWIVINFCVDC
jgi:hypothetical protein